VFSCHICSQGKVVFSASNNTIVGNVLIPCSGITPSGKYYDSSRCGLAEYFAWAEMAQNYVQSV
jgi:hypothetical protein